MKSSIYLHTLLIHDNWGEYIYADEKNEGLADAKVTRDSSAYWKAPSEEI